MRSFTYTLPTLLRVCCLTFLACNAFPLGTDITHFRAEVIDKHIIEPAIPEVHGTPLNQRATFMGNTGKMQYLWETFDEILPSEGAATALTTLYSSIMAVAQDSLSNSTPQQQLIESHYGAFSFVAVTNNQRGIPWLAMVALTRKLLATTQRGNTSRFALIFTSSTGIVISVLVKLADVATAA